MRGTLEIEPVGVPAAKGFSARAAHVAATVGARLLCPDREPKPAAGRRPSGLAGPGLLGFVGISAVVVGASQPGSPFALKLPGAWFFGTSGSTPTNVVGVLAVWGGLGAVLVAWLWLVVRLRANPGVPVSRLVPLLALWIVPLLIGPPLFSRDLYSYAAQGDLMTVGLNPYHFGPVDLGPTPYSPLVDPRWLSTAAPYGPLFLWAAGLVVTVTAHHVLASVIGLRLLALAGFVLCGVFLPALARSWGKDPAVAVALALASPVALFGLVASGHNDALMLGLAVAALAEARRGRPFLGIVLAALATAVKAPAAVLVVFLGWEWLGPRLTWRARVRPVLVACLAAGAVLELLGAATGLGWGWLPALTVPGTVSTPLTPTDLLAAGLTAGLHLAHLNVAGQALASGMHAVGLLVALAVVAWLLGRSDRLGSTLAIACALLAVVVLSPTIQPWYLAWGLVPLAAVATGPSRRVLFAVTALATFGWLPDVSADVAPRARPLLIAVQLVAAALALLAVASWSGWRPAERPATVSRS